MIPTSAEDKRRVENLLPSFRKLCPPGFSIALYSQDQIKNECTAEESMEVSPPSDVQGHLMRANAPSSLDNLEATADVRLELPPLTPRRAHIATSSRLNAKSPEFQPRSCRGCVAALSTPVPHEAPKISSTTLLMSKITQTSPRLSYQQAASVDQATSTDRATSIDRATSTSHLSSKTDRNSFGDNASFNTASDSLVVGIRRNSTQSSLTKRGEKRKSGQFMDDDAPITDLNAVSPPVTINPKRRNSLKKSAAPSSKNKTEKSKRSIVSATKDGKQQAFNHNRHKTFTPVATVPEALRAHSGAQVARAAPHSSNSFSSFRFLPAYEGKGKVDGQKADINIENVKTNVCGQNAKSEFSSDVSRNDYPPVITTISPHPIDDTRELKRLKSVG